MFDIHQKVYDDDGEASEGKVEKYIDGLMRAFGASPEAQLLIAANAPTGWAQMMLEYGLTHCGTTPPAMSVSNFKEVLFELFPRKVSTEAESAPAIVNELKAFWQFVKRQYDLRTATPILAELDAGATEKLRRLLADPSNYGMAKSMFMMGQKGGFDMTTQEGLAQFMLAYNSRILGGGGVPRPAAGGLAGRVLPLSEVMSAEEREAKRKARKKQREARKRNRK